MESITIQKSLTPINWWLYNNEKSKVLQLFQWIFRNHYVTKIFILSQLNIYLSLNKIFFIQSKKLTFEYENKLVKTIAHVKKIYNFVYKNIKHALLQPFSKRCVSYKKTVLHFPPLKIGGHVSLHKWVRLPQLKLWSKNFEPDGLASGYNNLNHKKTNVRKT